MGSRIPRRDLAVVLAALSSAAFAYVAMTELGRLVGQAAVGGVSFSPDSLFGPGTLLDRDSPGAPLRLWQSLVCPPDAISCANPDLAGLVQRLLWAGLVLDVLFIGSLLIAVVILGRRTPAVSLAATVVVGFDLLEDIMAAVWLVPAVTTSQSTATPAAWILHFFTMAKWIAVVIFVLVVLGQALSSSVEFGGNTGSSIRIGARRLLAALKFHRLSVLVVAFLVFLLASPSGEIGDQLPDVVRQWTDSWTGMRHGLVAVAGVLLLALQLLVLGRFRARRYADTMGAEPAPGAAPVPDPRPDPPVRSVVVATAALAAFAAFGLPDSRLSIAVAAIAVVVAVAVQWTSPARARVGGAVLVVALGGLGLLLQPHVQQSRFLVLVAVIALVVVPSALIRARTTPDSPSLWVSVRAAPARRDPEGLRVVRQTGDALGAAIVVVAALGVVRAFTAVLALPQDGFDAWAIGLVVTAYVVCVVVWLAMWRTPLPGLRARIRSATTDLRAGQLPAGRMRWSAIGLFAFGVLVCLGMTLWPLSVPQFLGVIGTAVIALGTVTSLLALALIRTQLVRPWEVFRPLGLRATPLFTLIIVVAFVGAFLDNPSGQHAIRTLPGAPVPATPLGQAFDRWVAQAATDTCGLTVDLPGDPGSTGSLRVRPVVLVAAAGGGIRAAQWTTSAMEWMRSPAQQHDVGDPCPAGSVFLSSGVSGGSVGLTVLTTSADPLGDLALLRGPDALSSAVAGLVTTDLVQGLTGIAMRPAGWASDEPADRAAFIEATWEDQSPGLTDPFYVADSTAGPAGSLVLNSTSVSTLCRVSVSTLGVATPDPRSTSAAAPPGTSSGGCRPAPGLLPGTYDVASAYLACADVSLRSSTAALLSARFPYVTPSGVGPECGSSGAGPARDQYVDGGYAEATGLGTVSDVLPAFMTLVRRHNSEVIARVHSESPPANPAAGSDMLVLPYVVFLENHFRLDARGAAPRGKPETVAPLTTKSASVQLGDTDALLERIANSIADWVDCTPPARRVSRVPSVDLCRALDDSASLGGVAQHRLVVVAPNDAPRIEAPLGWVLSDASTSSMDTSLVKAVETCGFPTTWTPASVAVAQQATTCNHDIGDLQSLRWAVGPRHVAFSSDGTCGWVPGNDPAAGPFCLPRN